MITMIPTEVLKQALIHMPAKVWDSIIAWVRTALGQMATVEFWIKLLETIVTQMANAFMITLGGRILTYGVSREDPEVKKNATIYGGAQQTVPAAAAFNGNGVRPDYQSQYNRPPEYNRGYQTAPTVPVERSFPHIFGGSR